MIISCTGHRPKYLGNEYNRDGPYSKYIKQELQKVIDYNNPTKMITGMALGVDTIWAELAIENKIPFIAAIPFSSQHKSWSENDKKTYNYILEQTNERYIISGSYTQNAFHKRDKWMVNNSDILVAVLNKKLQKSGTGYTVNYAIKQYKPIIYIDPEGWKNV